MVEHRAFKSSNIQEKDTGVVELQIPFGVENFYPRRSVPIHFLISRVLQKYRAIFSLLTVETSRAIWSSRVTGLFTVLGILV